MADDNKSVKFQRDHVKAFAAKRGWLLPDEFIFEDDGKSRAEFARRPGYVRLMASLKPQPPFGILIMYDETRLGREQIEVGYALKQIVQAGIEVWFSKDERRRTLDTPVDVHAVGDELRGRRAARPNRGAHACDGRVVTLDHAQALARLTEAQRRMEAAVPQRDGQHRTSIDITPLSLPTSP